MAMAAPLASRPATMTLPRDGSDARKAEFDRIFTEYSAPIYNYALRMVGDADRAADVAQDTFIKAYRKLDTLTQAASTRAWLYRIATNTAIDEMRRRRRVAAPELEDDRPIEQPDGGPGPETQVLSGLMDERISRALLRLRPNHRQCLILSDVEDMSAVQIGEVMGMSNGAVRVLLCRARGEMRRLLAAEGLVR
jgi:RNA polymerase sigma-70 factor (ECF subfamily)